MALSRTQVIVIVGGVVAGVVILGCAGLIALGTILESQRASGSESLAQELYQAVYDGDIKGVERLLQKGADPDFVKDEHFNTLTMAVIVDSPEMVELLLAHGADADSVSPGTGRTPLAEAALSSNREKCFFALLESGASATLPSRFDRTPLHFSILNEDRERAYRMSEALVAEGADPNYLDQEGTTPFGLALLAWDFESAQLLLENGAKLDRVCFSRHGDVFAPRQLLEADFMVENAERYVEEGKRTPEEIDAVRRLING